MKFLLLVSFLCTSVFAKVETKKIEYKSGELTFEGFLAFDTNFKGKRPGVLVVHNWMGVSSETESKVTELAKLGYVAFAGDIYGKGVRPVDTKEAGALASKYKSDVKILRERASLALEELKKQKNVNPSKVFVTGYCFGGTAAIELARSGAEVLGIVSFHGGLTASSDDKAVKGKVLVLHGALDPFVAQKDIDGFVKGMNEAKVDYQMISYANAVHSFTEKAAGNDNSKGAAYNELADKRSWVAMREFLSELTK